MRIGIVADTHGNEDLMMRAAAMLQDMFEVERFIHLGDNEGDADKLSSLGLPHIGVPGIYDSDYPEKGDSCAHMEDIGDFTLVAIHDLRDLGRLRGRAFHIVCHAHSHSHTLAVNLGKLFLNPGHLKGEKDRGNPPSCAFLEIKEGTAKATIVDLKGEVLSEMEFILPKGDDGSNF